MPKLRQDPTTKEWVIFASERSKRPHDFVKSAGTRTRSDAPVACPFCPGNEALTPPEISALRKDANSPWSIRVIPNKFAALVPGGTTEHRQVEGLYREMDGVGAHEVIIETPEHNQTVALLPKTQIINVLTVYRRRYLALRQFAARSSRGDT